MTPGQTHYLVKILSGPHLGAEVRLVAGSYRIGRDEAADIVLEDQVLASEHALLVIEAEGIKVEPLLGEVLIDHVPHKEPTRRLPFFTVLALGMTHLAVGPEGASWPAVAVPQLPVPAASVEILPPRPAQLPETSGPGVPALARPGGSASRAWPMLLLAGVLALVLFARPLERTDVPAATLPPDSQPEPTLASAEAEVTAALAGMPVSGLKITQDTRRGRLGIEGWVDGEAERKAVAERLAGIDAVPLQTKLWTREQVVGGVATTLQALGRPLESEWVGPGEVALRGYIPDASDLQRVVDLLQRDVTGLRSLRNEVTTNEAIEAWLNRRLAEAGLSQALRVRRTERALQVRGTLSGEQRAAFDQIAAEFADGPGRYLGLEAQIAEAQGSAAAPLAQAETLQFPIRAVSPGPPAYIVLDDGQKYLEGGRLPGGWMLERINETAMLVSRGGRRERVLF